MDLIYTDENRRDVGVMRDYTFDLAFGSDENDFELTLDSRHHCCGADCFVYIEGTEYGGIIDELNVVTKNKRLTYKGRTWHGILASKIIEPDEGEPHLTVSGEANLVIGQLLKRLGLTDLFSVSSDNSGLTIENFSFDSYVDAYSGLSKMLESVSGKLKLAFVIDKVVISALPSIDYTQTEQFDDDQVEMEIRKIYNPINHLICLGSGELEKREVIHLYRDKSGTISKEQTLFGLKENTAIFDYPTASSSEMLVERGVEKLESFATEDKVDLNFAAEKTIYDIGDIIGAKEITTGTVITEKITKKIVTINQGLVNIEYKVGE